MTESSNSENSEPFNKYQDLLDTISGICYIIDKDYTISNYSKSKWDNFAEVNDGPDLAEPDQILGKSILDFFAGDKVKAKYKGIYDLIFQGKRQEIKITAKCDAPEALRDNVIFLSPVYRDPITKEEVIGVFHQSLILKVDHRPTVELVSRNVREKVDVNDFIEMCSLCKNVKYEHDDHTDWVSAESYYGLGGTNEINLGQSICDECSNMLNEFM